MKINTFALQQLLAGEDIYMLALEASVAPRGGTTETELDSKFIEKAPPLGAGGAVAVLFRPKHKVLILVNELNPTDSELLEKILGAVQLNLQNVEVIEMNKNKGINLEHIFTQKSVSQLISFGVMMSEVNLMLRLTPYQILESKGVKFLSGVSLTDLQNDVPKKKLLWGALKEMF
jgi:DNA polymerase III psi subunit